MSTETDNNENIGTIPQSPVFIHNQYLKDMSFENPNAPSILQHKDGAPELDMNIMIDTTRLEHDEHEHFYEVVLTVNAVAKRGDKTMFIAEIKYAAAVSISGMEEKQHHPILFVEVPRMIFPYTRMILSNATQSGSFIPLHMAMVDFRAMYLKRFGDQMAANKEAAEKA